MRIIYYFVSIILTLSGCSSKRSIHNVPELTQQLMLNSNEQIVVNQELSPAPFYINYKNNGYTVSKYPLISEPLIADGKIFTMNNKGTLSAFSLNNRQLLWENSLFSDKKQLTSMIGGGIEFNNGKLFVTNGSRYLIEVDANTGYEILRKEFSDIIKTKPILVTSDIALIQTISNQLEAYNLTSAKVLTMHESYPEPVNTSYYMNPFIYNSNIITIYNTGIIFALNYTTGKEEWLININNLLGADKTSLPGYEPSTLVCKPIQLDNTLYIATSLGQLLKINLDNGQILWNIEVNDVQSMSVIGNSIFVTNNANQVAALSLIDGKTKWIGFLATGKKSNNPVYFAPYISVDEAGRNWLTILSNQAQSYNFILENNVLANEPVISEIPKNISYTSDKNYNGKFIIVKNQIIFLESNK